MMKKILFSLFTVLVSFLGYTQSNNCNVGATNLPVNGACVNTAFTNNANGVGTDIGSCGPAAFGSDIWFTVTGTGNDLFIQLNGTNRDATLAVYTACISGEVACVNIASGVTGALVISPSVLGQTYLVQVVRTSGTGNQNMSGNICAIDPLLNAPPPNDEPCTAIELPVGNSCTYTTGTTANATASLAPLPGCSFYNGGDVWYYVVVPANGIVSIDSDEGVVTDGGAAIYSGSCTDGVGLVLEDCDDDGSSNGLMPAVGLGGQTPGDTLFIRFWEYGNNNNGTFDICATTPSDNFTCDDPDPVCSGTPIVFNTTVTGLDAEDDINPGNDYDCLGSSPDPTWYYLEISTAGNLVIDMTGSSDIDFAIWGPFADVATAEAQCDSYGAPADCSFSISATETATVNGVVVGEVYVLVVTNFAGTSQTITLADGAGNTAATDCTILGVDFGEAKGKAYPTYNLISWTTLAERNNSHFIVEKRINDEFVAISDHINGKNNSSDINSYTYVDENSTNDVDYYKVTQYDFDGKTSSSDVIVVSKNSSDIGSLKTFPNPFDDQIKLQFSLSMNQNVEVSFANQLGHIVYSEVFECAKGGNSISLNTLFKSGLYFINVKSENDELNQTQKLIKK